jgi:hypothetical protein
MQWPLPLSWKAGFLSNGTHRFGDGFYQNYRLFSLSECPE